MFEDRVARLGEVLVSRGLWLCTAESCTGGLVGHVLTSVSGSSLWYVGGVVAYANSVKEGVLGVPPDVLAQHGAVSREVVEAMASGAAGLLGADVGVSLSGVAGPTGGTPDKPVGLVWIGFYGPWGVEAESFRFGGGREEVKRASAEAAVEGVLSRLEAS
ncbi:CinA family protein [Desulfohalovibrio reitneri]|uniref:CinA family protein n=1 Tax=Desulfohalovibrio reitneri TaxID=1307759 RepID=UPI0004A6BE74|nr:CinA family protein [Desulfohalovibrio reitneri]